MPDLQKAVQVKITGRVQGVGFRDWTSTEAEALGIAGWVRNERDGSVSALLVGPENALETMLERFWNGPRHSAVSGVEVTAAEITGAPSDFRITR